MKKLILVLSLITLGFINSQAQLVITPGGGAGAVSTAVGGPGLTISNVVVNCANVSYGSFSGGAASGLGITNGLVLTTGTATQIVGANTNNDFSGGCVGTSTNDPQLTALSSSANNDVCIIEFDVVPQCATMTISFVFGSDEYTDYVNSTFNDAFGFFVTGPNPSGGSYNNFNLATIPGGTSVSIDNVSHLTNSTYFVNNNAGGANNSFDGFTTVLNPTINVTPCQTYHFKLAIADATDCAMDSGVMIDIIQCISPWTVAMGSTPASCGATNGTATATVSGGIGPFTYSWAPSGGTGSTASGLAAGTYTVTVNDGLTCTPPQTYTTTVAGSGGSTTSVNSPTICAGASTTLTATPVTGGGTYSWAPGGATTAAITVSPASTTTYTVSYTLTGCTTTSTGTVTVNPVPTVSSNSQTVCAGLNATLTATPSIAGGTYSWAPGGATTAAITVSPASTTTYTVTYTLNSCTATGTGTVTVNPAPTVSSNSQTICAGVNATLTATPSVTGGTYSWAPGGATTAAITVSPASTTTYTVTYTLAGCSATGTGTVTVNPVPTVSSNSQTICAGANATLTATPSAAGGTYSWAPGGATTAAITVSPASTTTYTVTYTLAGCTNTGTGTVTVNPIPAINVNSGAICPGGSSTLTATGGTSYLWSTSDVTAAITVSPASTTSYTVTGTTAGCSASTVATVTVGATMSISVNSPSICTGQTANLVATGATSYTWSAGVTVTGTGTADASPATTTSYTVTGTTGSCSGTGVSTVTVNAVPVTTVDSPIICDGATATMTAAGAAGYTWSAGATSAGANTATASPTTTTTYTVTGANGVCVSTAVSTVTVNPIPAVTVDSPTICAGQTATMTAAGATSYTWSAGATSAGANTATASPAATTTYTVTGTASGCSNTAVSTVTVAPSLSITVNSPVICAGETANLTAGGAASYTWTAGTTVTGTNTADATPAATTTYTVTGTTGTCSGTAVSTVTVTPLPVVTVTSATICDGAAANLTAGGASTYTWTAGATATGTNTADASPSTTTTYTVTGTDLGCSGTAVSTVTVNPIPTVTVSSPSICPGSTAQLTAGGATSYTWSPGATSTGPNTADATPASTATYTVTGTLLGCSSTAVATVTVNTVLSVDAGLPDSLCFGESANLSVSPNGAGYVYTWTPAASLSNASIFNPVASPAVTTTYSVTVTDPNGCTGNDDVTVYADPQITLALAGLPVSCNGGTDGQTIVIPAGGSGSFTYLWMTGGCTTAACNQAVGTYTVTVTDTWGCTATGTAVVTEPTVVTATSTQTEVTCFGTCNGTATATGLGGTPDAAGAYTYSWNTVPVQTTQTATGLCAGTYTCTVSDDNGCSATVSVTITEPALLDIDPMPALTICNSGSTPLAATVTGGTIAYTYSWSPAAGLSSTAVANPTATPAATTTYTLTVTDANLCSTTESVLVTVNPPLAIIAAGTASVCPGASTTISAIASNGAGSGYTYLWSPAAGLNDATLAAPTATPAATTTYTVTANDGCSPAVTATVTVSVLPTPVPVITSTVTSGCEPLCVSFTDASTISSGTITGWNWDFGDGSPDSISQNPSHCFNTPGSYTVTLTDTSAAGCIATSTIPYIITVNPIPVALFNAPASTSIFTPTVQYIDQSTVSTGSIVSWDWAFGDGFTTAAGDSSHLQNPSHLFTEVGTYCAELIVTTNAGCQDLTSLCIVIDPEFTFFIPNAFSPNDDGINEEFYGKGEHIKEYEMNIFDRWGNLIFHADDINEHWDGRANHGSEVAQEDVYVYVVKLTDNHDKIHKYIGTVTIVK
jgi:gliding motility-associated-like protein